MEILIDEFPKHPKASPVAASRTEATAREAIALELIDRVGAFADAYEGGARRGAWLALRYTWEEARLIYGITIRTAWDPPESPPLDPSKMSAYWRSIVPVDGPECHEDYHMGRGSALIDCADELDAAFREQGRAGSDDAVRVRETSRPAESTARPAEDGPPE